MSGLNCTENLWNSSQNVYLKSRKSWKGFREESKPRLSVIDMCGQQDNRTTLQFHIILWTFYEPVRFSQWTDWLRVRQPEFGSRQKEGLIKYFEAHLSNWHGGLLLSGNAIGEYSWPPDLVSFLRIRGDLPQFLHTHSECGALFLQLFYWAWIQPNLDKKNKTNMMFAWLISGGLWKTNEYIKNSGTLVRQRTIPTERPPLVGEVSANLTDRGCRVVSATNPHGR
jgi:hypothetical protein